MSGGTTRYRTAYNAGSRGSALPEGLSSQADADPLIDSAHDAGRQNVPYDQWHSSNVAKPAPTPGPSKAPRSKSSSPRRTTSPSFVDPTGGRLPISFDGEGVAGVFFGAIFYALVLSVIEYGAAGPGLWFKAKFLNQAAPAPSKKTAPTKTLTLV